MTALQVYAAVGDKAKFQEYSDKALAATDNPQVKTALENIIETLKEKKSETPAAKVAKPSEKPADK